MAFKTAKEYLESLPKESREILEKIRQIVVKNVPEAQDGMGYGVPAYRVKGKALIYYAAFKNHIGIYPNSSKIIELFKKEGKYETAPGTIRIPISDDFPYSVVERIVKLRMKELG